MAVIKVTGYTEKNQTQNFTKITEFQFQSDRFTPADSFRCVVCDKLNYERVMRITVSIDKIQMFEGIVDVQRSVQSERGRYTEFICRSLFCLMLDNEVKPCTYEHYSADHLLKEHAYPFGVTGHTLKKNLGLSRITAHKGSSHWEFIELFCQRVYKKTPFLNREKKLTLEPLNNRSFRFSNQGGQAFTSIEVCEDRYDMISKLWVKTGKTQTGAPFYGHVIDNGVAKALGIRRERYYHPTQEWENDAALSGAQAMRDKQYDYSEIIITLPDVLDICVGDRAEVLSELGNYDKRYVSQVQMLFHQKGLTTKIKLWDERVL